jgi:hypothetical protein
MASASGPGADNCGQTFEEILIHFEKLASQWDADAVGSESKGDFESAFRIRGRPILPPLVSNGAKF